MSAQVVRIEDEQIKAVKNWPELMSVRDIQVFVAFANFYRRIIQRFSRIAILLISLLKIIGSSKKMAPKAFRADNDEVVGGGVGRAYKTVVNLSKNKKSKNLTCVPNIGATKEPNFLTFDVKENF